MKRRIIAMLAAASIAVTCAGCAGGEKKEVNENSVVRWYMPISSLPDTNRIHEMAQDYILEKTGIETELIAVNFGDYEQKLQMINASREVFDLSFVSNWMNFYNNNIRRGGLVDITELIKEHAPQTYANIPEQFWEAAKYDGKLYAVINQQIMARGPFISVAKRNDNILNYNWEGHADFVDAFDGYLEAAYEYCKKPTNINGCYNAMANGFEEFLADGCPAVINYRNADDIKVFNQYESPEFKKAIAKASEWTKKGWTPPTPEFSLDADSFFKKTDDSVLWQQVLVQPAYKPGVEAELFAGNKVDTNSHMIQKGFVSSSAVTATMTGVSTTSENPANALKVVEIMNNDKYLFNLICYGIEGEHYTKVGENRIEQVPGNEYNISNWAIGNVFNNYILPGAADNVWEETDRINKEAIVSPIAGFQINLEPIKIEFQNCNSVVSEYSQRLVGGFGDLETNYAEFIKKLKDAGVDKLIEESQRQIDEWLANKQ